MDRRTILKAGVTSMLTAGLANRAAAMVDPLDLLQAIRATPDRMFRVTVCLRPFRATGPRIEVEQVGRKQVVHNYGHGGSGWSLSWGSAAEAVALAMAHSPREIAVIGAGALGMTAALTAQRAGAKVTIYAKESFPYVRSARATGAWTPDSRIAMEKAAGPGFGDRWEKMARTSFAQHQAWLGLPGTPVEWTDRYFLSDNPPDTPRVRRDGADAAHDDQFVRLEDRLADITPRSVPLEPGTHPFAPPYARRSSQLTFNVADLSHQLMQDFLIAGGTLVPTEFHHPSDMTRLKQPVIINCTGYGARALWRDESIIPVRGQIAWLIPQPDVTYGIYYDGLYVLARRDGIVVQAIGPDDWFGFGDDNEQPDRAAALASIAQAASFYAPPKPR